MVAAETELLADARRLQLDHHTNRPLHDLELLARLQHQHAATRLLDVTTNALIAAWFAVEDFTQDGADGAVFGIDMTDSELPVDQHDLTITEVLDPDHVWLWRPPLVDPRIRAQQGAFIFSKVFPDTTGSPITRDLTTLGVELTSYDADRLFKDSPGSGRYPKSPVVIFQIPAGAKPEFRAFLTGAIGYTPDVIYPDLAGFTRSRGA